MFLLFWKWLQPQKPFSKPILFFVVIVWEKDLHLSFKDKEKLELKAISLLFISKKDIYIYVLRLNNIFAMFDDKR